MDSDFFNITNTTTGNVQPRLDVFKTLFYSCVIGITLYSYTNLYYKLRQRCSLFETPWTIEPGVKQDFIFKERFDFYNLLEKQSNDKKNLREQLLNRALEVYKAVDFYKEKEEEIRRMITAGLFDHVHLLNLKDEVKFIDTEVQEIKEHARSIQEGFEDQVFQQAQRMHSQKKELNKKLRFKKLKNEGLTKSPQPELEWAKMEADRNARELLEMEGFSNFEINRIGKRTSKTRKLGHGQKSKRK
ncbi:uncharacterized protein LOC135145956 [Zophobas morio]|uniref:uncharacterized protein LOC135145956 n=1 Tax=Zophobas morio TaxID=2755281 RepID=UPI0030835783